MGSKAPQPRPGGPMKSGEKPIFSPAPKPSKRRSVTRAVFQNCNVCGIHLRYEDEFRKGMCINCQRE